jgi:hypothetical protein
VKHRNLPSVEQVGSKRFKLVVQTGSLKCRPSGALLDNGSSSTVLSERQGKLLATTVPVVWELRKLLVTVVTVAVL